MIIQIVHVALVWKQSRISFFWHSYPFHIAKWAVTPHWTPLSIHPLCCCYTPVCFHTECRISAFWRVRFKKRSKIEQKDIITPMHCLAFPSALFGAPFHIDNRTVANCGFWLEYASKTPLEVGADLPRRMRLFRLRCQIMRLRSVHIKPHYSQNAFDSALLAWYERGISVIPNALGRAPGENEYYNKMKLSRRVFSQESKRAQFKWSFELPSFYGILDCVYANLHRDA